MFESLADGRFHYATFLQRLQHVNETENSAIAVASIGDDVDAHHRVMYFNSKPFEDLLHDLRRAPENFGYPAVVNETC